MCRLVAYLGRERALEDIVIRPPHSLLHQSAHADEAKVSVNGDGFGIAWYGTLPEPGLFRHTSPAWSDANLASLTRHVRSSLFMAHVRAANVGEATLSNCHPFVNGPWAFMHNGQIRHFDAIRRGLECILPDELYLARRGTTDSELIFLLLLHFGLSCDPAKAMSEVIALIAAETRKQGLAPDLRLTAIATDGKGLLAFRHATGPNAPTLYMRQKGGEVTFASEPLDSEIDSWVSVAPDMLVQAQGRTTPKVTQTALFQGACA